MRLLSPQAYARAREAIDSIGRPLDQALARYYLDDGPAEAVATELVPFQNTDGGFGSALEPDIRASASTAVATSTALGILSAIGAAADSPVVRKVVGYLMDTYDGQSEVWPIITAAVEDAPHAPWWDYASAKEGFGGFLINPTVMITRQLLDYAALVPEGMLARLVDLAVARLPAADAGLSHNDALCYVALWESEHLPDGDRERLSAALPLIRAAIEGDAGKWGDYSLQPLEVVPEPSARLQSIVDPALVARNLDYWIDQQLPDGTWPVTWSWAFIDGPAWAQAERDWKGHIAVHRLKTLRDYGRIG